MPLLRYFLLVGGMLLGLLFWANWYFPFSTSDASSGDIDRSIIRVRSNQQWPAAVPIDTSVLVPKGASSAVVAAKELVPGSDAPSRQTFVYAARPRQKGLTKLDAALGQSHG